MTRSPGVLAVSCFVMAGSGILAAQTRAGEFEVYPVIQADVSPRLSAISQHVPPQARANMTRYLGRIEEIGLAGRNRPGGGGSGGSADGALQTGSLSGQQYSLGPSHDGVGEGFPGFTLRWAPPDTNMAVGPNHYIQWVNDAYAIFDRISGNPVLGSLFAGNAPWSGWNNACATNNDGDPIVQYDRKYDRWIFTQFSISTKPYLQCVAVSTSGDPTGSYYRFAINFGNSNFPDYPKLGIWPTGYFLSFNVFKGSFIGSKICAIDRIAAAVTQDKGPAPVVFCKQLSSSSGSTLPADQDGDGDPTFPELFMSIGSTSTLNAWTFVPNYGAPASSVVTQLPSLTVPAFSKACGGGACIPQSGTSQQLDSLGDRLMYRLAYRKVGSKDYLVATHSVNPNKAGVGVSGIRWYQLTATGATPTLAVVQKSTYAPDGNARWMGSIAMDGCGNIGVGYSVSGGSINPKIAFAGRLAKDPADTLLQEVTLQAGGGSQTAGLDRWGDYSSLRVDPSDDRTFFFTTEYLKQDGTFNWSTRISRVTFTSSCPAVP